MKKEEKEQLKKPVKKAVIKKKIIKETKEKLPKKVAVEKKVIKAVKEILPKKEVKKVVKKAKEITPKKIVKKEPVKVIKEKLPEKIVLKTEVIKEEKKELPKQISKVETKKVIREIPKKEIKKQITNINHLTLLDLEEAMKTGQVFDALVKSVDNMFNLNIFFANGIKGIIPREEVSSICAENGLVDEKVCLTKEGKILQASIKEINKKDGKLDIVILSCRELELKVRRWMFMHLKDGMKLKGIIRGMTDYAAFIDVGGGVTGMLKLEDISNIRIMKVSDKLKFGERIEVVVKKFDRDTGKIDLSIKELGGTFKEKTSKLTEGSMVDGIVRNREKNGIFVELGNDLVGLAEHVSGVEYGQKVLVHIKKINIEKERIKVKIIG